MPIKLDLHKSADTLRLNLTKRGIDVSKLKAQVCFDLDVSGSYKAEHKRGETNQLLMRLVPWGMVFDPNGELDVFSFADGDEHAYHVGVVTPDTCEGYVQRNIIGKVPGWERGTTYSHVLEANLRQFGWIKAPQLPPKKPGFFERLLGAEEQPAPAPVKPDRSLVIFNTDGGCERDDKRRTHQILRESQNRGDEIYFLFLAYARKDEAHDFGFLKEIADAYSNTGLVIVNDLDEFTSLDDDALNEQMLGQELIDWLKAAS